MTEPRRFENSSPDDLSPIPFEIAGFYPDGSPWVEEFSALPAIPAVALDHLSRGVSTDEDGNLVYNKLSVVRFIRMALLPDEERRFNAVIGDKRKLVRIEVLGEIMLWLAGEVGGLSGEARGPSSRSGNGVRPGGSGSPETSFSPGSTSATGGPSTRGGSFG